MILITELPYTKMQNKSPTKHPDNMTRKEKLAMLKALDEKGAVKYWINYCPTISKKSFDKARGRL